MIFCRIRERFQPHLFIALVLLYTTGPYQPTFQAHAANDDATSSSSSSNANTSPSSTAYSYNHNIPLERFQDLLHTEIHNEIYVMGESFRRTGDEDEDENGDGTIQNRVLLDSSIRDNDNGANDNGGELWKDQEEAKDHLWDHVVQHGWAMSETLMTKDDYKNEQDTSMNTRFLQVEEQRPVPFLLCSTSPLYIGAQRVKPMLKHTQPISNDYMVVSNEENETCYHITTTSAKARFVSEVLPNEEYTIVPMTDLMKISVDTLSEVSKEYWALPTNEQRRALIDTREAMDMAMADEVEIDDDGEVMDENGVVDLSYIRQDRFNRAHDWERIIYVGLVCGEKKDLENEEAVHDMAQEIVHDVRKMGEQGAHNRRTRRTEEQKQTQQQTQTPMFGHAPIALSVTEAFSLTSTTLKTTHNTNERRVQALQASRAEALSQSLQRGMEADHSCSEMFDRLVIRAEDTMGFDIVLNPDNPDDEGDEDEMLYYNNDETSASNVHCITSLIVALSTHPMVLTVEQVGPVLADDVESQYITQSLIPKDPSKYVGMDSMTKRFDLGTVNFPLSNANLHGNDQVVTVADSGLDVNHRFFGPTARSVFSEWDFSQRVVVRYRTAGDDKEWPGGHGSKVAGVISARTKGSGDKEWDGVAKDSKLFIWDMAKKNGGLREPNTNSFFSEMYNGGKKGSKIANGSWSIGSSSTYSSRCARYDQQLYNKPQMSYFTSAGNSGPGARTIDDPGVCKNVVAVGASQSINNRITRNDKGPGYITDYSSTGPSFDGRIKPEIVAPGYTVLTAYGNHTGKPRDDDTSRTSGTSFSSPIAAGCAAQVRQYFEERFYPYGKRYSGQKIEPSGPLVKAVLMNGAQRLYGVQDLPGKADLSKSDFFDSKQGFGLINLQASLPLDGENDIKAVVVNDSPLPPGDTDYVTVRAVNCPSSSTNTLSASLAWNDPPAATNCNNCMINGFYLRVEKVGGSVYHPNGQNTVSAKNNAQRVRVNLENGKRYKISVQARSSNLINEKYSMITTGCFIIEEYDGEMECTK